MTFKHITVIHSRSPILMKKLEYKHRFIMDVHWRAISFIYFIYSTKLFVFLMNYIRMTRGKF